MKRNFKTLAVGKQYVNSMERPYPRHIVSNNNGYYKDHLGEEYTKEGYCYNHNGRELNIEVTVTVTPVEPQKMRELYGVYKRGQLAVIGESAEIAKQEADMGGTNVILFREVKEGEE